MKLIDALLNRITMYRLVLYYLIALILEAVLLSFRHVLAYDPYAMLFSTAFILAVCSATNYLFSRAFDVPANVESAAISALILALIITPISGYGDLWFLFWASVTAMASKYIININGKHIFNPVAFGVALTYLTINQSASWWVGNPTMLPIVLIGGLLVTRKVQRFRMVLRFLAAAIAVTFVGWLFSGQTIVQALNALFAESPLFFFAFVMLTEPLTSPPTDAQRNWYGAIVGLLFAPAFHIGSFYTTPEIALLIGNVYSWLVSPKRRLTLSLKEKKQISPHAWDFIFTPNRRLAFAPGQYMEWTLGLRDPDSRGNRRYFTLASAPTEEDMRVGVRFNEPSSTYKDAMLQMEPGDEILAGQLMGDLTLPKDPNQPLIFIAGGIGITPYRSMIQYLLDIHQPRPITIFYGAPAVRDFVYQDVFDRAERELGIRTIYIAERRDEMRPGWVGLLGLITPETIRVYAPNYKNSIFYISGPNLMVNAVKSMLRRMGIPGHRIKTDFFAGL